MPTHAAPPTLPTAAVSQEKLSPGKKQYGCYCEEGAGILSQTCLVFTAIIDENVSKRHFQFGHILTADQLEILQGKVSF